MRAAASLSILALVACDRPPVSEPSGLSQAAIAPAPERWREIAADLDADFPEVAKVSTADLAAADERVVLVDVRAAEEFAVGHLQGARNVPFRSDVPAALADVPRDARIVVYCSVGRRSAMAARELTKAGFARVENLDGSLFAWANEGRPMVDADGPTDVVHPYDENWGELLAPERRSFSPK